MKIMQFIRITNIKTQSIELSFEHLSRLKFFGLIQSSVSVRRNCIIEWPYKLLVSKYMIFEVGLLTSFDLKTLLLG